MFEIYLSFVKYLFFLQIHLIKCLCRFNWWIKKFTFKVEVIMGQRSHILIIMLTYNFLFLFLCSIKKNISYKKKWLIFLVLSKKPWWIYLKKILFKLISKIKLKIEKEVATFLLTWTFLCVILMNFLIIFCISTKWTSNRKEITHFLKKTSINLINNTFLN